ncbi:subtilisin-like protease SBT3.5 [Zingiber officinale]|uniref:subtilisin-like protease SBT3.5 n=1 Tax=Zingiber officinale TaxID=94328 RepID=UPI001C4CC762|nr:subtilisin-like protease SBT3.5 [Zingiber officinale]
MSNGSIGMGFKFILKTLLFKSLYIVYLGERKHENPEDVTDSHVDMLTCLLGSKKDAMTSIVYSYRHGFSGFAAMLTEAQVKQLAESPDVICVEPNRNYELQTTRSWDFLGLQYDHPTELLEKSNYGDDIIIGIIDTGIWPESKSFDDDGYGPIPSRWKGVCQVGDAFGPANCNRKIIGARYYTTRIDPAQLKMDYISPRDFNGHGTLTASVAAGSIVHGANFHGLAAGVARGGAPRARLAVYKAVWGTGRGNGATNSIVILAAVDDAIHDGVDVLSLSLGLLQDNSFGVLHAVAKGLTVVYAAGNSGPTPQTVVNTAPWVITVAASTIDRAILTPIRVGQSISAKKSRRPYGGSSPEVISSPKIARFSSRGPTLHFPGILKPDIAAPGVNILGAYRDGYKLASGTSFACPHVSGVVVLLKALHPDWSHAVIKSALVTTATNVNSYGMPIQAESLESLPLKIADPFDFGGGQIDPNKASDPGLVYDIDPQEYYKFFKCTEGEFSICDQELELVYNLNLPSICVPDLIDAKTVGRTVTNVGKVDAVYKVSIESPPGVKMTVAPSTLVFDAGAKVQSFKVTFMAVHKLQGNYVFGSLTWSDGEGHAVRIPIAVRVVIQE